MGAPGCQVFKVKDGLRTEEMSITSCIWIKCVDYCSIPDQLHVHDSLSLDGFVSTASRRPSDKSCPGVYSLACEMVMLF